MNRRKPICTLVAGVCAITLLMAAMGWAQFKAPPETGQVLQPQMTMGDGLQGAWALAFSPDGKTLATTGGWGFRLWDVATGELKLNAEYHQSDFPEMHVKTVTSLAFSPDGKTIATASLDMTVRLWDAQTGKRKAMLQGHKGYVNSVTFSPDGTTLLTASEDATVILWDAASGKAKAVLDLPKEGSGRIPQPAKWAAFSPDGKTFVVAEGGYLNMRLWDATTGSLKKTIAPDTNRVAPGVKADSRRPMFSPDGKTLATGASDKVGRLWDLTTGKVKTTFQHDYPVMAVVFSPDGRLLVTVGEQDYAKLWNPATGKIIATLKEDRDKGGTAAAFSPDGRTLATSTGKNIFLWEVPAQ